MNLPNSEISKRVQRRMQEKGLTLSKCCDAFNTIYHREIEEGSIRPLNKDFLSRVGRNAFRVCSPRILKLCEFLEIHESSSKWDPLRLLPDQIRQFREQAGNDTEFRTRYSVLERFLCGLNLENLLDE